MKEKKKKKQNKLLPFLGLLLLLIGNIAAGYPLVGSLLVEYRADAEIDAYEEAVAGEAEDERSQMLEEARLHNESLAGGESVSAVSYNDLLAVTDAIGYLEIPKLGIYLPIYHGLDEEVLQKGIGHIPETSLPVGGESTHCVLSGHSGLPAARILTELDQMEEGDRFYIHVLDETLAYEVDQISVVLPEDTEAVQIEEGRDLVTIVTCTPYGINTHRLLVRGERTEYTPTAVSVGVSSAQDTKDKQIISWQMVIWMISVTLNIILLIVGIWLIVRGRKKQRPADDAEKDGGIQKP